VENPARGAVCVLSGPFVRVVGETPGHQIPRAMTSSDYRIEKQRIAVAVSTVSGATMDGEIFVQTYARHRMGREEPADIMNSDEPFFPLALVDGGTMLLAKEAVSEVLYEGTLEDDAANVVGARSVQLEVILTNGERRQGAVFLEVSVDRPRVLDFLNRFDLRFLTLHTREGVRLVNRRLIERVCPAD
jgi:hypothetical protein